MTTGEEKEEEGEKLCGYLLVGTVFALEKEGYKIVVIGGHKK